MTSSETGKRDRGIVLGFLQIDPHPTSWHGHISDEALQYKTQMGFLEKWTFAMPVVRAWRVTPGQPRLRISEIAFHTYDRANVQNGEAADCAGKSRCRCTLLRLQSTARLQDLARKHPSWRTGLAPPRGFRPHRDHAKSKWWMVSARSI